MYSLQKKKNLASKQKISAVTF